MGRRPSRQAMRCLWSGAVLSPSWPGEVSAIYPQPSKRRWPGLRPTACTDLGNDPPRPWLITVVARLVRAINSSTCAATGGPDKPGHDDVGTFPAIGQASDFAVASEMCELGRDFARP